MNYDLTDDQPDGELPSFHYVYDSDNSVRLVGTGSLNKNLRSRGQFQQATKAVNEEKRCPEQETAPELKRQDSLTDETGSFEALHGPVRYDKSGNTRSKQRARKLQLGDIDWYGDKPTPATALPHQRAEGQQSLDQYIVDKKSSHGHGSATQRPRGKSVKG